MHLGSCLRKALAGHCPCFESRCRPPLVSNQSIGANQDPGRCRRDRTAGRQCVAARRRFYLSEWHVCGLAATALDVSVVDPVCDNAAILSQEFERSLLARQHAWTPRCTLSVPRWGTVWRGRVFAAAFCASCHAWRRLVRRDTGVDLRLGSTSIQEPSPEWLSWLQNERGNRRRTRMSVVCCEASRCSVDSAQLRPGITQSSKDRPRTAVTEELAFERRSVNQCIRGRRTSERNQGSRSSLRLPR